jgi:hypothetical protein
MAIGNILGTFGIFYDHLVQFAFVRYLFPVLVSCIKKNLATLAPADRENVCRPHHQGANLCTCFINFFDIFSLKYTQ